MEKWISRHRPKLLRLAVAICLPLILFTHHSWSEESVIDLTLDDLGLVLVSIGALGRIWCTLYIAGRKSSELITAGPYSICRNPLYFFTGFVLAGLLCIYENILLVVPVVAIAILTHVASMRREERFLADRFGPAYATYADRVPRLLPNLSRYRGAEPGQWGSLDKRLALRGICDSLLFLPLIPIAEQLEHLHLSGALPVYLYI